MCLHVKIIIFLKGLTNENGGGGGSGRKQRLGIGLGPRGDGFC